MDKSFRWQELIYPLEEADLGDEYEEGELGLKRLRLSVYWQRQNTERSIDIITYAPSKEYQE